MELYERGEFVQEKFPSYKFPNSYFAVIEQNAECIHRATENGTSDKILQQCNNGTEVDYTNCESVRIESQ